MKIALLGGETLLDRVFLNMLSQDYQDLEVDCYGEIDQVSFGDKVLQVKKLLTLEVAKYDIIINFSKKYLKHHEIIKRHNVIYWNYFENDENSFLLPDFACPPIDYLLNSLDDVVFMDICNIKCVGELGKEALNRFHREIQDRQLNLADPDPASRPLALSCNIDCLEDCQDFEPLACEKHISNYLKEKFDLSVMVNAVVSPLNKSSISIFNFKLKKEIDLVEIARKLEKHGLVESVYAKSSVLIENDDQIYYAKLKKIGDLYSVTLVYDALYIYANWLISKLCLAKRS